MSTVIKIENISKKYYIGAKEAKSDTLRDVITDSIKSPFQRFKKLNAYRNDNNFIWALKGVSFDVKEGDIVGIIGRNGAGKSTLLKIISRITEPTEGCVKIKGRVASLLEVGTGFHPELTGRENIYLNGTILGMTRPEINRKFDEIVDFSEIEKFLDTPVKRYSSGMYVRLAFAVAAHLEPEILVVDEVLAVGDAAFQKKCLGKMHNVSKGGRTVLFVSHNTGAVSRLCNRSFWLDKGKIVLEGTSDKVVSQYQSQYLVTCSEWKRPNSSKTDNDFAFLNVSIRDNEGRLCSLFAGDQPVLVGIHYTVHRPLSGCQIGTRIYNSEGIVVFSTSDADYLRASALAKEPGCYKARFVIPGNFLSPGTYYLL